jgi:hypothetical protein
MWRGVSRLWAGRIGPAEDEEKIIGPPQADTSI